MTNSQFEVDVKSIKITFESISKNVRFDYDIPLVKGEFLAKTWQRFDLQHNLNYLLSGKESFPLRRKITLDAFCAWMLGPNDKNFIQSMIASSIIKHLSLEDPDDDNISTVNMLLDEAIHKITQIGPDFFSEIYYPLGGLWGLSRISSHKDIKDHYQEKIDYINRVIFMTRVLLHGAIYGNKDLHNKPSKNIAVKALEKYGRRFGFINGNTPRSSGPLWDDYAHSALFLYAAQQITVEPRAGRKPSNMLEALLDGHNNIYGDKATLVRFVSIYQHAHQLINENCSVPLQKNFGNLIFPPIEDSNNILNTFKESDGCDIIDLYLKSRK